MVNHLINPCGFSPSANAFLEWPGYWAPPWADGQACGLFLSGHTECTVLYCSPNNSSPLDWPFPYPAGPCLTSHRQPNYSTYRTQTSLKSHISLEVLGGIERTWALDLNRCSSVLDGSADSELPTPGQAFISSSTRWKYSVKINKGNLI